MHLRYLLKTLAGRKGRNATTVLSVAVLVAVPVVLASVVNAYQAAIYLPFEGVGVDLIVQKSAQGGSDVPSAPTRLPFGRAIFSQEEVDSIAAIDNVEDVSPALSVWQFDEGSFISIEGLRPNDPRGKTVGSWVTAGRSLMPDDSRRVVLEKHFAKFYGVQPGDTVELNGTSFDIVGIMTAGDESQVSAVNVCMNLGDAQELLGVDGCSKLYLRLDTLSSEDRVRSAISRIDAGMEVVSGNSIAGSLGDVMRIYDRFRLLGSAILALIVALILFQVNATALLDRRRDIGIMQSVGWTRRDIGAHVVSGVVVQTILGCIVGIGCSFIIASAVGSIGIHVDLSGGLSNEVASLRAPLAVSASTVGQTVVLALAVTAAVSSFLVRRVCSMRPLSNLRTL